MGSIINQNNHSENKVENDPGIFEDLSRDEGNFSPLPINKHETNFEK